MKEKNYSAGHSSQKGHVFVQKNIVSCMCDPGIAWDDRKADQKPGNTSSYNDTGAESYKAQKNQFRHDKNPPLTVKLVLENIKILCADLKK